MSVIDKAMYENLKNRCHYKRPENQFLTYLNIHDRALTNATVRKLMHTIDKEDVEGEVYCEFFSAENFYRNMRDYYSYIGKCYFKEPEPDDPIENIIDELPPTCGWITVRVDDVCEKMDRLADVICKCTYEGDMKEAWKFMFESREENLR